MAINYFDVFIILMLAFFTIRGLYCGFFEEASGIVAIVLSIFLLRTYGHDVTDFIGEYSSSSFNYLIAVVIIMVGTFITVSLAARLLGKLMSVTFTGWINRLAGAAFGLVKGLFFACIIAFLVSWLLKDQPLITDSVTIPYLQEIVNTVFDFAQTKFQLGGELWKKIN